MGALAGGGRGVAHPCVYGGESSWGETWKQEGGPEERGWRSQGPGMAAGWRTQGQS